MYITSPSEIHVNISDGAFETRAHGIFVTNINFKASSKNLREHFNRAGRITECLLQRDRSTGGVKGNATLQYASPENVRRAVGMFDGEPFIGRRLRVRVDRVFAVSNPLPTLKPQVDRGVGEGNILRQSTDEDGPVIVDGSR
jgi:RNA recognition motif-containing protein